MKNMILDKKTVPVPERGERIDGGKTLREKKIVLTAVCVALAAVLCCVGVIGMPAEVEGLALQEKVTSIRLKEAAEEVLKKASLEDALKGVANNDVLKEENTKDTLKKAAVQYDTLEKAETVAPKTENAGIETVVSEHKPQQEDEQKESSSQQARQQEAEKDFAIENEASGKVGILKSAESTEEVEVVGKGQTEEKEKDSRKKTDRQNAAAGENDKNNDDAEDDSEKNDDTEDDGENKNDVSVNGESDADADDETQANDDLLQTPVEGFVVSSPFGPRWGRFHAGIDLALAQGNPIYASDNGTVIFSGYSGGYGNLVKIDHGNGMQTNYAHCSQLLVTQGQQVERGETIALVGSTGNSTGPHLHFEVLIDGSCVDPASHLDLE